MLTNWNEPNVPCRTVVSIFDEVSNQILQINTYFIIEEIITILQIYRYFLLL